MNGAEGGDQASDGSQRIIRAIRSHYRSGASNLGEDFFAPCLRLCSRYARAAGFFSSSALIAWSNVLPTLAHQEDTRIHLLTAPILSEQDRAVMQKVSAPTEQVRLRQELADRIVLDAFDFATTPENVELRLRLLAWLLVTGRLELRFAFPEHIDVPGIYHEKIGLFEFPWGDVLAFTGSANETFHGHYGNYESIDVFRSWMTDDNERVRIKQQQFTEAWDGLAAGLQVLPLSERALEQVKSRAPDEPPLVNLNSRRPISVTVRRWQHQGYAVDTFLSRERGILEMATGTGKTRTALRIAEHLIQKRQVDTLVVAADGTDLLNQWYRELVRLAHDLPEGYVVYRHYEQHHDRERFTLNPRKAILLTSRPALAPALKRLQTSRSGATTLLIHDEVHRLGSPANQQSLCGLTDKIRFRLGLSATPEREYDAAGTTFISEHVGPVVFHFTLEDAIERGVLCPFDYHALSYNLTEDDRDRLKTVYKMQAARIVAGNPMSQEEVWIALARVYKTSRAKLPIFRDFIRMRPELLRRCIIFVEDKNYGAEVLDIVHRHRPDFHAYFSGEDAEVLQRFANGEIECLLTCHRLSEGIDIRDIQTVILFSASRARLETIQRIGRCLRINPSNPGKRASIVDFVRTSNEDVVDANSDEERQTWLSHLASIQPEAVPS